MSSEPAELVPVRMVNEFAYCPRLFHLMHVEGRWEDNYFTADGQAVHRRVDRFGEVLPDPEPSRREGGAREKQDAASGGDDPPTVSRSVALSNERLGITSKLDLVSTAGDEAVPVETKRGRAPNNPERSWEPERVQLMAQGLLLREEGYRTDHGVLYFAASRTRVDVPFTEELLESTLAYIESARQAARQAERPPPLEDNPKCNHCSLNGICLPDETLTLMVSKERNAAIGANSSSGSGTNDPSVGEGMKDKPGQAMAIRRLFPARDLRTPLYVQEQGAMVGKSRATIRVKKSGKEIGCARLKDVSQVVLCGRIMLSAQALHTLCEHGVPIVHLSMGHWFHGITHGTNLRNAYDRAAQFDAAKNPNLRLELARAIVRTKGQNQRTMLRRNALPPPHDSLKGMEAQLRAIDRASSVEELLGIEGNIAAHYFRGFSNLLKPRDFDGEWDFTSRNRRPPKDPVNALLGFAYALLTKDCTVALLAEGLDPWWGLYHRPRHGRPAFALDLMEEFRPLIADSAVATVINTGMVRNAEFRRSHAGCMLTSEGRKALIRAFEARMDHLVTHPVFDYRCSWRAVVRLQARLLSRWLRGEIPNYIPMSTR